MRAVVRVRSVLACGRAVSAGVSSSVCLCGTVRLTQRACWMFGFVTFLSRLISLRFAGSFLPLAMESLASEREAEICVQTLGPQL